MVAAFDDDLLCRGALAFEAALASGQAEEGLIPVDQAAAIDAACTALSLDPGGLAEAAAHAGTLAIPLVERLRRRSRSHTPRRPLRCIEARPARIWRIPH